MKNIRAKMSLFEIANKAHNPYKMAVITVVYLNPLILLMDLSSKDPVSGTVRNKSY